MKELPSESTKSSVKSSKHLRHDSSSGKEVLEKFFDSLLKSKKVCTHPPLSLAMLIHNIQYVRTYVQLTVCPLNLPYFGKTIAAKYLCEHTQ